MVKNIIIWDKKQHGMGDLKRSYGSRYESIIFAIKPQFSFPSKRPVDVIQEQKVSPNRLLHPNEKPVKLMQTLINQTTSPNDVVMDCCMGVGSTGVACVNTNRNFIGMELDEIYFKIAHQRIQDALKTKDVNNEIILSYQSQDCRQTDKKISAI
jgi:site-specific DNA-methyltransferase (adenine-specific)